MRQGGQKRAPENGIIPVRITARWQSWRARRRATRNQEWLDAGSRLLDDPVETGTKIQEPQPPVTDVFSWLGRNPR